MKSGANISDRKEIYKMLKSGATVESISTVLEIQLSAIKMYTPEYQKKQKNIKDKAAKARFEKERADAEAKVIAEAEEEVLRIQEQQRLDDIRKKILEKAKKENG
jgi:aspartate carbamoyltransferase catalytic subunit